MSQPTVRRFGDPVLTAPNAPVESFDGPLKELVHTMLRVAWSEPGLGLAAPQIGHNLKLAVVDLSLGENPADVIVLANPFMTERVGARRVTEGCLSFPGLFTGIVRPTGVVVRAQDVEGCWREHHAEGKLAQAFCHELDHLDGVLLPDRLSPLKRFIFLLRVRRAARHW